MENIEEYVTVTQLSKLIGDGSKSEKRRIQRKVIKLISSEPNKIKMHKGIYYIHKSILDKFERTYKHTIKNPHLYIIENNDWNIFANVSPLESTNEDVLNAVMDKLFNDIYAKIKQPLKIYYIIETQLHTDMHIHYFIQSQFEFDALSQCIQNSLNESIQTEYRGKKTEPFNAELKVEAIDYLNKGAGKNHKQAKLISSRLISKGMRD